MGVGGEHAVGEGEGYAPLQWTDSDAEDEELDPVSHEVAGQQLPAWEADFSQYPKKFTPEEAQLIKETMKRIKPAYEPRWAANLTDAQLLHMLAGDSGKSRLVQ